ncbi:MAG TPA: lipoprotein-releasing system transmembrane subunit LolC, partial [Gammaproteobacteria bacterium]|nr:lipoprotein-releasing system transmembrane subunit LolC [Gammaproteobacteria bacterium]
MMTPAYIGLRYSRARGENRFLSFITWVSLLGLALGVVALIVVVSVMNGFDTELKRRILGAVPHVVVEGLSRQELEAIPGVSAAGRFSSQSVLLVNGSASELVSLYGIEPENERAMSIIPDHMTFGAIEHLGEGGIVLGEPLAYRLGVMQGDSVTVLLPVVKGAWRLDTQVINATLVGTFELD